MARDRKARGSVDHTVHKSSHSPYATVQIIRRSTSEESLGRRLPQREIQATLGQRDYHQMQTNSPEEPLLDDPNCTRKPKSPGRPPVRLAEMNSRDCTDNTFRQPCPAPQATEFGYPSVSNENASREGSKTRPLENTAKRPTLERVCRPHSMRKSYISRRTNLHRLL